MADKEIAFSDQEQQQIEAIVIDKDKGEAICYLAGLGDGVRHNPPRPWGVGR